MNRLVLRFSLILGGVGLAAGLYQNCGPGFSAKPLDEAISASAVQTATCLFNGLPILPGGSVTAFKLPNAPSGQQCISETRTCSDGVLSGSYTNASCLVTAPGNCALGAQEIVNGATASGYSALQVDSGVSCSSVGATATCKNGQLVPSIFPTCSVATPTSCKFNNQYVPNGISITAFLASVVPYGSLCSPEVRTCTDGVLSGSFSAQSCTPAPAASCSFGSTNVADGGSVQVFSTNVVPYGQNCSSVQETITCKNGVFIFADGSLATRKYSASCVPSPTTTCQYAGKTLQSGESVSGYLQEVVPAGQTCNFITATCNGGVMTGLPMTITYPETAQDLPPTSKTAPLSPSCEVGGCLFGGTLIPNQKTVNAYTTPVVSYSQSCSSVQKTLTCNNGKFVDSAGSTATDYFTTCQPAKTASCSFYNWANGFTTVNLAPGQTLTGYASNSVLEGSACASVQENISCNDGILSLNGIAKPDGFSGIFYFYDSCNVGACTISNQSVMNGATITAYSARNVPYGQSCSAVQATLSCKNSSLYDGTTKATNYVTTCAPMTTPNCAVNDWSNGFHTVQLKNGQTVTGYTISATISNNTCDNNKVTLSCVDGFISVNGGQAKSSYSDFFYSTCK